MLEALDLTVEVTKPSGRTYRFDGGGPADSIPTGIQFSSSRNTGFSTMGCSLPRRLDLEYVDIELLDEVRVLSASGDVRWEGYVSDLPRELGSDGHSISVQAVGYMAHLQDEKFRAIIVDRDLSRWGSPSVQRKLNLLTASVDPKDEVSVTPDVSTGQASLQTALTGPWARRARTESWYDAGGLNIGSVYHAWKKGSNVNNADGNWAWQLEISSDDILTASDSSGNLRAAGPGTGTVTATTAKTFAALLLDYLVANTTAQVYPLYWTTLAVYGDHGLTKQGIASATSAQGFYASDILRWLVETYAPQVNTDGVVDTSWVVPHLAYHEPTTVYDAMLQLNGYHLFEPAVWEDRTLHWAPLDLTDWDWEVRQDDPGVTISLQGDSAEKLVNGATVTFHDMAKGKQRTIGPDDFDALNDTSEANPLTAHGRTRTVDITLSVPTNEDSAVELGRIALAEALQAERPGTINVGGGYIRDRQGNLQPVSKVRSGDRIRITDIPADLVRPVGEASYNHDSKSVTIAIDSTIKRLEAYHDRVAVQLAAAGLAA